MREPFDEAMRVVFTNKLYNNYLFYVHLIIKCKLIFDSNLPAIAAVSFQENKYNLYINPKLFAQLEVHFRLGVLKHEMLHIVGSHLFARYLENLDLEKWNLATDCAINQMIDESHLIQGCILPNNLLTDKSIKVELNQNAEFYYNLLLEHPDKINDNQEQIDSHADWKNSEEDSSDQWIKEEITKSIIKSSIEETIKNQGEVPNCALKFLELSASKVLNWKSVLQNIIGTVKFNTRKTILKPNRRNPGRKDLKGRIKDNKVEALVIADESGSVSNSTERFILGEVLNLCKTLDSAIDIIQVDTEATDPRPMNKNTIKFERKKNGGTYLSVSIEKIKKDYDVIIILTDGELSDEDILNFKNLKKPIIWLVVNKRKSKEILNSGKMKLIKIEKV